VTSIEILKRYLEMEFPKNKLTKENKIVLARTKIDEEGQVNAILEEIGAEIQKCTMYYENYPELIAISDELQYFKSKKFTPVRKEGFGSFKIFFEWWVGKGNKCHYCGVSNQKCHDYFSKHPEFTRFGDDEIGWAKRGMSLEIDRIDASKGYSPENCELACYPCNNAKSNICNSEAEFKPIADGIKNFWENQ